MSAAACNEWRRNRLFRALLIFACLGLSWGGVAARAVTSSAPRPNILFIITDDHRWDALGVVQREQGERARFPWFATPNLDRLAGEGIRFRNAFVVQSLCSPSRAAFLSGQFGHRNGIVDNSTHFGSNTVNFAALLGKGGYATAYVGKFHMAFQSNRPGFQHVATYVSQGEYFGSTFLVNGAPVRHTNWVDDAAPDYALDFIRANRARPWMMMLGFKTPHTPRQPPERARQRFAGAAVLPAINLNAAPSYGRGQRAFNGEDVGKPVETDTDSAGSDEYLLNYFRCISAIDDNVGRLLRALEEMKIADDTVIVFAGDNGYFLGEHGLGDKRCAYDESMRIPLILRYPRVFGRPRLIDDLVLNIDLAPTLLELAGLPAPTEMQGASWVPLLSKRSVQWRGAFLFAYYFEPNLPATPALLAVRSRDAKLIVYPGHDEWTELFDLTNDPYERRNIARDAKQSALLDRMKAEFARQKESFGDPFSRGSSAYNQ